MQYFRDTSKPYVRWWWIRGPYHEPDIVFQLDWVKANGFGGVELAWIYPLWTDLESAQNPDFLGEEWTRLTTFTKSYADTIGLGCDFTFGSCWPFGGMCVAAEDAAQTFSGPSSQRLIGAWDEEVAGRGRIVNHLSRTALRHYAEALAPAFRPAIQGGPSALFCDSLEVDTDGMWSPELWSQFESRFGYSLKPHLPLDNDPQVRYDYRKFIAEVICREFYAEFTAICHELGAYSRVQCHGAPTDLLSAYAATDVPESESLLFPVQFSRIPASAATLASKPIVSCETFTCIYGFPSGGFQLPRWLLKKEEPADLKLLVDGLFANGINQVVWHGMPFNPPKGETEFYALVHVGPDGTLARHLPEFNRYMEKVCSFMRLGRTCCRLAIYLPNEDQWMQGATQRTTYPGGSIPLGNALRCSAGGNRRLSSHLDIGRVSEVAPTMFPGNCSAAKHVSLPCMSTASGWTGKLWTRSAAWLNLAFRSCSSNIRGSPGEFSTTSTWHGSKRSLDCPMSRRSCALFV